MPSQDPVFIVENFLDVSYPVSPVVSEAWKTVKELAQRSGNPSSPKLPLERFEVYAELGCPIVDNEDAATERYRGIVDDVYDLLERKLRA